MPRQQLSLIGAFSRLHELLAVAGTEILVGDRTELSLLV